MARHNLLVFIDSLPYRYVNRMPFFSRYQKNVQKVLPGFGYSINLKAEIFGGYLPDKAGFLNEWSYNAHSPLRRYNFFFRFLGLFQRYYYVDRLIHKILSRVLGYNLLNIPLRYLSFFSKNCTEAYRDEFHLPTMFSQISDLKKVCYFHYSCGPKRDNQIFMDAIKAISANHDNIFVAFGDLDGIAHSCGVGSEKYDLKIDELDKYLSSMHQEFQRKNPEGTFIVFSDHGMSNVNKGVSIDMESLFGKAAEDSYLYFVDATMLRVWCFDKKKKEGIERHLGTLGYGKVLGNEQRDFDGITSQSFGDIIFQLDGGVVFCPGFMGRKMPMAMHGYSSVFDTQAGLCLTLNNTDLEAGDHPSIRTVELYDLLKTQAGIN
jgi:hypothetical protein